MLEIGVGTGLSLARYAPHLEVYGIDVSAEMLVRAREKGWLVMFERLLAPLAGVIGWHSDFELDRVLGVPCLRVTNWRPMPPLGIFTFLIQQKA